MKMHQVQRFRDDNLPDDGTIYYAVNDGDGTYVQAVQEDGQQYQYVAEEPEPVEQENQEWQTDEQIPQEQQETVINKNVSSPSAIPKSTYYH